VSTSDIFIEHDRRIVTITFNRPQALNAITWAMYDSLVDYCETINRATDIRVVVLRGAGSKAFIAGTDITQFQTFTEPNDGIAYEQRIDLVLNTLEHLNKPTIAEIDGIAAGGGCAIAAACDLRICSDRSRFGVPIARTLGNCLSASNYARFLDLIGPTRLKEMLYTGRLFDSAEAKATGFVTSVVAPDILEASVKQMAETIAANAPLTIRSSKEMIRRVQEHRRLDSAIGHDLIRACYSSNDFKEGVLAFLQKRPPRWNGT
jgi:enoyl-CoA hydratase/carnithine racemase